MPTPREVIREELHKRAMEVAMARTPAEARKVPGNGYACADLILARFAAEGWTLCKWDFDWVPVLDPTNGATE